MEMCEGLVKEGEVRGLVVVMVHAHGNKDSKRKGGHNLRSEDFPVLYCSGEQGVVMQLCMGWSRQ